MSKESFVVPYGRAICYSGYREGQSPRDGTFPSETQVLEDLKILDGNWDYLRMYDPSKHAETVLHLIEREGFKFQLLLGIDLAAEINNPGCPWDADFSEEVLEENRRLNQQQIARLHQLVNRFSDHIFAVSIGNEASVDWTDHMVPVERLIEIAQLVREGCNKPVTFCENYVPWLGKLDALVPYLDFLSVHTYPVWEYVGVDDAMAYTLQNYQQVVDRHPNVPVVITEAGWTTRSNGRGIDPWNASENLQATYVPQLDAWSLEHQILCFVFEAFDEPWKGSADTDEPEKYWGLYHEDRTPKPVVAYYEKAKVESLSKVSASESDPDFFNNGIQPALS